MRAIRVLTPCLTLLATVCLTVLLHAESVLEDFEGQQPSWQLVESDCQVSLVEHKRVFSGARSGRGCELMTIQADRGTYVYAGHPIQSARAIEELQLGVWIRANRSGLQLLGRVVLPRSLDPHSGKPLTVWIRGTSYTQVGRWQYLVLNKVTSLLTRQTRMLRNELGPEVDDKEAFIDQIAVNIYGGLGTTSVNFDDIYVENRVGTKSAHFGPSPFQNARPVTAREEWSDASHWTGRRALNHSSNTAELEGSVLLAAGRPLFPRLLQYQGESFELLQTAQVSGVILAAPPTSHQLAEAERLNLWLVAPPPELRGPDSLGAQFDRVLAWDLGHRLTSRDIDATRRLADEIRRADPVADRPLVCNVHNSQLRYSRYADLLLFGRDVLGSSFELKDYGKWLRHQQRLARPGTPFWAAVQTNLAASVTDQWSLISGERVLSSAAEYEQMRLLALSGVAAGARGLCYASQRSLAAGDVSRRRLLSLAVLNQELSLLEPWTSTGKLVAQVATNDPQVRVSVLAIDRSHLLLPIRYADGAQYSAGSKTNKKLRFVVPGIPSSNEAYLVTSSKLVPLSQKRVTGGTLIVLDDFHLAAAIVLTQDPLVFQRLTAQLSEQQSRATRQLHDLAQAELAHIATTISQSEDMPLQAQQWFNQAQSATQHAQQQLVSGNLRASDEKSMRALQLNGLTRRAMWEKVAGRFQWPVASPWLVSFDGLRLHWSYSSRFQGLQAGSNLLPGGHFENLNHMLDHGWQQNATEQSTIRSDVELTPQDRKSGSYALRLRAWPTDPGQSAQLVDSAPLTIHSPTIQTEPGQLLRVHGWLKIPAPITGSEDGLLISDSGGGNSLALRILKVGDAWREFVLYRAANEKGNLQLSFRLTGLGEALIDAVIITPLELSADQPANSEQADRVVPVLR